MKREKKRKQEISRKNTSEAQHTHNQEDIRSARRRSEKSKTKTKNENCTSHSKTDIHSLLESLFVIHYIYCIIPLFKHLLNCRITSHAKHLAFPYGGPKLPHRIKVGQGSSHVNYANFVNNSVVST